MISKYAGVVDDYPLKTRTQGTDHAKITAASMLKAAVFVCSPNWNWPILNPIQTYSNALFRLTAFL